MKLTKKSIFAFVSYCLFSGSVFAAPNQCVQQVNKELPSGTVSSQTFLLCQKSAKSGSAESQSQIGWMYATGNGVKKDTHLAFQWTKKAADKGVAAAQNNLGLMYENGQGVRYSTENAKKYFGLACDHKLQLGCDNFKRISK